MKAVVWIGLLVVIVGAVIFFSSWSKDTSMQQPSQQETQQKATVQGQVIAGTTTPYLAFTKAEYDNARSSGKVILLNFYATWCPICRAEIPDVKAAFDELTTDKAVGFQVNFNDPETDADEKALAKEFNVPYQHTKVLIKDGKVISQETAQWTKEQFMTAIHEAVK